MPVFLESILNVVISTIKKERFRAAPLNIRVTVILFV